MALLDADKQVLTNGSSGMPWWVRAIGFFGVPSALAIFLVWNMAGTQAKDIADAKAQLAQHAVAAAVHATNSDATGRRIEQLLQRICVNTAKSAQERVACFQ